VYIPQGCARTVSEDSEKLKPLSMRELEVLNLLKQGKSSKEIADTLGLSIRTVDNHVWKIYNKVGVNTRAELRKM